MKFMAQLFIAYISAESRLQLAKWVFIRSSSLQGYVNKFPELHTAVADALIIYSAALMNATLAGFHHLC